MRVLHVIGSFNNGGVENLLINLTRQQIRQGLEVGLMIVTNSITEGMKETLDPKVIVLCVNKPVGNHNPLYFMKLNWMYHQFSPDVLHLHSPYSIKYFVSLGRKEKRFVHVHNNVDIYGFDNSINQYLAISKSVYDVYHQNIHNNKCTICYNGIDFSNYKEKENYATQPKRLIQVGRLLMEVKGQDITLSAFKLLITKIPYLQLEYWGDGPDVDRLREMVRIEGLENSVKVVGDVDNKYVKAHLKDFDVAIFSSRHEGLGLAAIEAMGVGLPVILSNVDGHLEISENGRYASLFISEDIHSLAKLIHDMIRDYPSFVDFAHRTKKYIKNKFSIEEMSCSLLKIYNDL